MYVTSDAKPWYKSKTIWLNGLTVIASVAATYGYDLGLDEFTKASIAAGAVALVNVGLRIVTKGPVTK